MNQFKSVMKMAVPGFLAWMIVTSFFSGAMSLTAQSAQVIDAISNPSTVSTTTQMSLSQIVETLISAGVIAGDKATDARPVSYTHLTLPTKRIV